ncbi:ras GTPase-activating protein-binding protein 1 [Senna tora]|uniref:Ras GTPase-activating protein-binding protein 1 n=1 Tax=Senna tora TaxID=362788 RepID=A0A835CHD1_9FABA|nr:ras GTPase-activating protein-binding protein 1 [Senna tora]
MARSNEPGANNVIAGEECGIKIYKQGANEENVMEADFILFCNKVSHLACLLQLEMDSDLFMKFYLKVKWKIGKTYNIIQGETIGYKWNSKAWSKNSDSLSHGASPEVHEDASRKSYASIVMKSNATNGPNYVPSQTIRVAFEKPSKQVSTTTVKSIEALSPRSYNTSRSSNLCEDSIYLCQIN